MRYARATAVLAGLLLVGGSVAGCLAPWADGVQVPQVTNRYPAEAGTALTAAGLRLRVSAVPAITGAGTGINGYAVSAQDPAPGTRVAGGDSVALTLVVSANGGGFPPLVPDPATLVRLPSVIGLDPNAAIAQLAQLGVLVDLRATGERTVLAVTSQTPSAGSQVAHGSHVTLGL